MPGVTTKYNLVDDVHDLRLPMHNEDVFQHGVCFEAKYIGSLEVGRPGSRMEIVAAMRRIRYEFKLKNIKKKKVNIVVSTDCVRVILRKKKKRKEWSWDDSAVIVTQDPIYRIFYVSHDAQDLKIFSYIARDGQSNIFRCNVFKSKRKSQAMRIVRTVGQAFDVCHQLNLQQGPEEQEGGGGGEGSVEGTDAVPAKKRFALSEETDLEATTEESIDCLSSSDPERSKRDEALLKDAKTPYERSLLLSSPTLGASVSGRLAADAHQVHLLQRQLEQQEQQAQAASAQVHVLQEQLSVEVCARTDAQARVQRLLQQNTDLLQHISLLVKQIQELELKATGPLKSMGSMDSLLEITFRAKPPHALCCGDSPLAPTHPSSTTSSSQQGAVLLPRSTTMTNGPWGSASYAGVVSVSGPCSPGSSATTPDAGSLGIISGGAVRLECFRFTASSREVTPGDAGETPGGDAGGRRPRDEGGSPLGEQQLLMGALELLRFRESGIGSEYESNTDESEADRDSWGHGEGGPPGGPEAGTAATAARLFNVLNADSPSDSLGDEMAV